MTRIAGVDCHAQPAAGEDNSVSRVKPAYGGEHRLDNGLLLRSDVHVMFDHGYVGVDPSYRLRVSPRLRSEFGNGDSFYAKAGEVVALPERRADRPNPDFLRWHLVLGGTRFVGDRIVRAAQRRGDEVTIVHRGSTEPAGDTRAGDGTHIHIDRADFAAISAQVRALRPDAVIDTCAMTRADADSVLPHLPEVPIILLSSMDVYRAYELVLADEGGQPVPITEDADLRRGRYPLRGHIEGHDEYDKLDVEPAYLARGGTVLHLGAIYGERDPQRREEFILRRVRAGRKRIPVGAGTWLWTRGYVADASSAVLAALDAPAVAAGQVFNVGEPATDTMREYARRIVRSAGCDAELVTVPDEDVPADLAMTRSVAQHFLCDSGKLARTLGWRPADPELSVGRSVRWHLDHPPESADADFTPDDRALAGH